MARSSSASASQLTARRSVPPLSLIAAVFFLPTFRRCSEFGFERPLDYADSVSAASWIVPVFAGAAVMALLTVRAVARSEVSAGTRRLALATLAVVAMTTVGASLVVLVADGVWRVMVMGLAAVAAAAWTVRQGRGESPWRIWEHLLCAFALLAAGAPPTVFLLSTAAEAGVDDFGIGAYVYLLAIGALLWTTRRAAAPSR